MVAITIYIGIISVAVYSCVYLHAYIFQVSIFDFVSLYISGYVDVYLLCDDMYLFVSCEYRSIVMQINLESSHILSEILYI